MAALAGDEMLVEEGAIRAYRLLAPLLQQQDVSTLLFQPLSELHSLLAAITDTTPSSITGHKQQRQRTAQVLAAASCWRLRLLDPVHARLTCGSFAVASNGVVGLRLKPSAALTALDGALLRALGGTAARTLSVAKDSQDSSPTRPTKGGSKKQLQTGKKQKVAAAAAAASETQTCDLESGALDQAAELVVLQELLLWHPSGPIWAAELFEHR